jgi:hypothetical protein
MLKEMAVKIFRSLNKINIRLTSERLNHILTNHPEMTEFIFDFEKVIEKPDFLFKGKK